VLVAGPEGRSLGSFTLHLGATLRLLERPTLLAATLQRLRSEAHGSSFGAHCK
jgi:hypothetical protein